MTLLNEIVGVGRPTGPENLFRKLWDMGYGCILPIIPPGAKISLTSGLHGRIGTPADPRGKLPGMMRQDGTWSSFPWTTFQTDERHLDRWHAMGAGVGLRTGNRVFGVDIDVTDPEAAARIRALALEMLGPAPERVGRAPKCLLVYAAPRSIDAKREEWDFPYMKATFSTTTEDKALVEVLTDGKQFVCFGIHPKTMQPYSWPSPMVPFCRLTEVTLGQLRAFMNRVAEIMPGARGQLSSFLDRESIPQDSLKAADKALLADAIRHIPNDSEHFPGRDDQLKMAVAIKAAYGPDYEAEALEDFLGWCEKWDGGDNAEAASEAMFDSLGPPFAMGADYLYGLAEKLGGWTGRALSIFAPAEVDDENPDAHLDPYEFFGEVEKPKKPIRFKFMSGYEVLAQPEQRWLIERYITETSFGLIWGDPGAKKSFIALDMAMHVALGRDNYHGDKINAKPGGYVAYIAGEGAPGMKKRMRAWMAANGKEGDDLNKIVVLPMPVNFLNPAELVELVQDMEEQGLWPLNLLIVDTVSRSIPGADENAQKEMSLFVKSCDALKERFKVPVLGAHHASKAGTVRGSSVLTGAVDWHFHVESPEGAHPIKVKATKVKDDEAGWTDFYDVRRFGGKGDPKLDSLVPFRLEAQNVPERGKSSIPAKTVAAAVALIDHAWEAGEPLSRAKQAKNRWAGAAFMTQFGMNERDATRLLEFLIDLEIARSVETGDTRNKTKGLQVVRLTAEAILAEMTSDEERMAHEKARELFGGS